MAGKPVTGPHKAWNIALHKRLEAYNRRIESLLDRAITQAAELAMRHGATATEDVVFSFSQDRQLKAETEQLLRDLSGEITRFTRTSVAKEWEQAYKQSVEYLTDVYNVARQTEALQTLFDERLLGMKARNMEALRAFQERKIGGMGLSSKVWDYTRDFGRQMEVSIDQALLEGRSAEALSRDIRSLLRDPDALFRRVRDDNDELRMSRAMAAYHPGRGRYRSAYMNAMRLARSEINMAYRSSDSHTAQEFDACVGIEVHLSNNHNCKGVPEGQFYDICDELQGRYPKDFKFVGWHPQCYDEDSEVYTADGWKYFSEVDDNDLILSLNPETRDLEYVGILYNINRHYKGQMVHFFNKSYSQFVTPEHEVLCLSKQDNRTFRRIQADKCGKSQPIYRSSKWRGRKIEFVTIGSHSVPFAPFAKFMGYWLSDGSLGHKYAILIAQEDTDRSRIYDCIAEMGMRPRYNGGRIEFNDKDWYEYLQQFGKAAVKFIPAEIKESDKDGIRIFLDAFISCDGHIKKAKPFVGSKGNLCVPNNDERTYCTTSRRMADDIGELLLKVGYRPSFRVNHTAGKQHQFRNNVYTINYDCITITECHSQCATQYNKEYVDYDGMVYDLTLERNNTMYIRRNGKCFWGSNCRCYTTYILKTDEEFWRDIEDGVNRESVNTVKDVPDNFKRWLSENEERVDKSAQNGTLPYFLRDNGTVVNGQYRLNTFVDEEPLPTAFVFDAIKDPGFTYIKDNQRRPVTERLKGLLNNIVGAYGRNSDVNTVQLFDLDNPAVAKNWWERDRMKKYRDADHAAVFQSMAHLNELMTADLSVIPVQWQQTMNGLIRAINAHDMSHGCFGVYQEIEHAYNIYKLSTTKEAVAFGFENLSDKTPYNFFTVIRKKIDGFPIPPKAFFDRFDKFIPLVTNGSGAEYCPDYHHVRIALNDKVSSVLTRLETSEWFRKTLPVHEFGHAYDYQRGVKREAAFIKMYEDWKAEVAKDDGRTLEAAIEAILKTERDKFFDWWKNSAEYQIARQKTNDAYHNGDMDAYRKALKEYNKIYARKYAEFMYDLEEQVGGFSDCLDAALEGSRTIYPRSHGSPYFLDKDSQLTEFFAHCSENYWGGNEYFKMLAPDLYRAMCDYVKGLG